MGQGMQKIFCVLAMSAAAVAGAAQQPAEDPAAPLAPAVFANQIPAAQLAFIQSYQGKRPKDLMKDKQFKAILKLAIPSTTYHYGQDMSLRNAFELLIETDPLPIDIRDGHYAMAASHGGSYLDGRTFLWLDLQEGIVLGGVYFHPINGEPTPTLAIFSKQLSGKMLAMGQLPPAFIDDVYQWALVAKVPTITVRYFIPADGRKYMLEHDEDYCAHPPGAAPPEGCEQANADAADADMNAAYFMKLTGNQANATAWMLNGEQTAWLGQRESMCGAAGFACRIAITRQRTHVLTGRRR